MEKVAAEKVAISKMSEDGERISVPRLMKMMGLSRGFFYKNLEVRWEIDRAMEQIGIADSCRSILDKVMDGRIELLQQQVAKLKQENDLQQKENQKLKNELSKQDRNTIRKL